MEDADNNDMEDVPGGSPSEPNEPSWGLTLIICAVILAAAGGIAVVTFMTEPTAEREGATKKTPMLVKVMEVERGDHQPDIVATGTVRAEHDIQLRPQVSGLIVDIADNFRPGGFVEKGDVLVRLESADYRNALALRQSELSDAEAALALEMGQQDVARSEAEFFEARKELKENERGLILREPQLRAAKERVKAAKASVDQAKLQLSRATIRAPFDAHVLSRDANVGSQVGMGDMLGRLVGVDTYWVAIDVPLAKLRWITLPEGDATGALVRVRNRTAWPEDVYREGRVDSLVGALDSDTRLARILAIVEDPFNRRSESTADYPLMVGEFVEARVQGKLLKDVVRIERDLVRDKDTVWVKRDGKLAILPVTVVMRDRESAYISDGLEGGEFVVTTNLSSVKEGAPLRTEGESKGTEAGADDE